MFAKALLCLALILVVRSATELTADNFKDVALNGGKNSFVKFFAPWCGHCKRMAPAWDQLSAEYEGTSVVVGDVDCTVHADLCKEYGVSGYPTIKYWKDGVETPYQGGRDYEQLKQFVVDNLQVLCNVEDPKDCNDKEKSFIDSMKAKADQVGAQLARLKGMASTKVAAGLKQWINQRINILTQLSKSLEKKDL